MFDVNFFPCIINFRLSLASNFEQQVAGAELELDGDEQSSQRKIKNIKRW